MTKKITLRVLLAATALFTLGQTVRAADAEPSRVSVTFENPEKFTDIKDSQFGTDKGRDHYLKLLRTVAEEEGNRLLPAGQKLALTFHDIDLAGDYLPSMPANRDIRVMKDIFAPRMKLSFTITDAAGAVVKEGAETVSDMNYLNSISIVGRSEELYYDRTLLRDWLRRTLK